MSAPGEVTHWRLFVFNLIVMESVIYEIIKIYLSTPPRCMGGKRRVSCRY
jgi:hypothetical protein